jgi:GDPmannose 4,6-dehydratase
MGLTDCVSVMSLELCEHTNVEDVIKEVQPDEVYNLAARSSVGASFHVPVLTGDVNALGVARLLESIRRHAPEARFYQASTCEMFGRARATPQNEDTPLHPLSPYAASKAYAHYATINYREAWGLFASCGILFNHESPLRAPDSVTRKIASGVALRVTSGNGSLQLGNLNARRDWGFAGDYVRAMWAMLQADEAGDYVVATGVCHSVRDFATVAFASVDIDVDWAGEGVSEKGFCRRSGDVLVEVSPELFRPSDVDALVGDATKAREKLGLELTLGFEELVELMVRRDIERLND